MSFLSDIANISDDVQHIGRLLTSMARHQDALTQQIGDIGDTVTQIEKDTAALAGIPAQLSTINGRLTIIEENIDVVDPALVAMIKTQAQGLADIVPAINDTLSKIADPKLVAEIKAKAQGLADIVPNIDSADATR